MGQAARPLLLLVDPNTLFRRTLAMVARELNIAMVVEANSHELAQRMLEARTVHALLMDVDERLAALALVQGVRAGSLQCPRDLPIALTAGSVDAATLALFGPLGIKRVMLKPFKVKTALEVVRMLVDAPG
ncbi:response regulator [Paucibacter soli]|uniref:response regulator n=1 Tax=Paucibacter soli TaxID=3133433 RepID=UPI003095DC49